MRTSAKKVTGILLAGGMSRRMGREKGSLKIGAHMMYEYPLKALESVCDEILVSSASPLPGMPPHPLVPDKFIGIGPMGGLHACLDSSSNELNLVLSYDLPMIREELLNYLLEKSASWDLVLPSLRADRPEPLCGLYRKGTEEKLIKLIEKKQYAVHQLIPLVKSLVLPVTDKLPFYHPNLFLNINRMEDLDSLPEDF